jgi:hemolysin III
MYKGERFNSISHLIGAAAALAGLAILVVLALRQGDPWKIVSFSIYGTTLLLLYTSSTLYHGLRGKGKEVFRKLDYIAIYLLIAGTYTPFTLVTLRGRLGWTVFGVIWGLAAIGILLESMPRKGRRILPVAIYLMMGWLAFLVPEAVLRALPLKGVVWLLVGGMFYTVGLVFYGLNQWVRIGHGIWHLFVLAGSLSHYLAVFYYVA